MRTLIFNLIKFINNQLEKLECAKAAYLWLPFSPFTFGHLWLSLVTFPTFPYLSLA